LIKKHQSVFRLKNENAEDVVKLIKANKVLSKKINVDNLSVDKRLNAILAYDTQDNLDLLEKIIKDIDKKNGQVTIELYLVEMNRNDLKNFGFEFAQYPHTPKSIDILNIPSNIQIYTQLEALAQKKRANIISSPKIRVVHNKKAELEIADTIPVPYYTYEEANKFTIPGTTDNLRVLEPLKKYKPVKVGIKLEVTPYVHDNKEVSLDINMIISNLIKVDSDGQVYTSDRNINTFVRLHDRETAVLGGLVKQEEKSEVKGIPGIYKLPLLRALFRNRKNTKSNMEMLMFITPYFVGNPADKSKTEQEKPINIKKLNVDNAEKKYYNIIGDLKKISD
jgi:general secretion pathway protein D